MTLLLMIIQVIAITVLTVIVAGLTYIAVKQIQAIKKQMKSKKEDFIFEVRIIDVGKRNY